ncbi:DUF1003 domain-containing protein [Phenylobacterium sp.]|uniref:DUF1003 domain-containing protein n=1 Tax=Phenylobacterium sp. TaxID=1871053 RepID=UPI00272EF3D9|nr:DUF1003 domain-containing protein [Phenylobacterium sp.]MDP1616238.1 DUF1003 domain-containing protein [Phenylobacterium sp.]MDP1985766.1 DUF1003 domain-containing protein [Phenylobacterium sp.]
MSEQGGRLGEAAKRWLDKPASALDEAERRVLATTMDRSPVTRDANESFEGGQTFAQRLADQVAAGVGSWVFIIGFCLALGVWALLNLALGRGAFDPYPFIFLNLLLSMLAAIQAPFIMMSQNRQAAKDRLTAAHDYEVNLKAEIEIMALHDKLDQMRVGQIETLLAAQQEQLDLIRKLLASNARPQD